MTRAAPVVACLLGLLATVAAQSPPPGTLTGGDRLAAVYDVALDADSPKPSGSGSPRAPRLPIPPASSSPRSPSGGGCSSTPATANMMRPSNAR